MSVHHSVKMIGQSSVQPLGARTMKKLIGLYVESWIESWMKIFRWVFFTLTLSASCIPAQLVGEAIGVPLKLSGMNFLTTSRTVSAHPSIVVVYVVALVVYLPLAFNWTAKMTNQFSNPLVHVQE
jgi:hypothetical protein